ncbi:MAG: hypothetical protein LBV18_01350 [Alistipes sp.]|jgi:hypothetical protein|nr:hypothetical protein [Alistipes sp.]
MRIIVVASVLMAVATISARGSAQVQVQAQTQTQAPEGLDRRLEVTREYTPNVGPAGKLPIEPNMTDTVRLRPEVTYRITPVAGPVSFEVRAFEPASVSTARWDPGRPLYLRAGLGLPLQSTLDLYFTPRMAAGSSLGLYVNHRGAYSKLRNDFGVKADATETYNGVGLWGSRRWARYELKGDVSYTHRRYDMYGTDEVPDDSSFEWMTASWNRVGGNVGFGDDFTDLSRLNFHVGLDGGYTRRNDIRVFDSSYYRIGHMYRPSQADGELSLRLGRELRTGHALEAEFRGRMGKHYAEVYDNTASITTNEADNRFSSASVAVRYDLSTGGLRLRVGGDLYYVYNQYYGQDGVRLRPALELSYDVAGGRFVPFARVSSRIVDGSMEALSRTNPYVTTYGATGLATDALMGFEGDVGGVFTYRLSGGASLLRDYNIMCPEYGDLYRPMTFNPVAMRGRRYTAGAEFGLRNVGGFSARLYGNVYTHELRPEVDYVSYDLPDDAWGSDSYYEWSLSVLPGLPEFDAGAEVSYSHKDVFRIKAGVEVTGKRRFRTETYYLSPSLESHFLKGVTIPTVADVSLEVEFRVQSDFWVFVEGRNLAGLGGHKLYPWPYYRGRGANVMAGIEMVF